jgi:hypothetical protein
MYLRFPPFASIEKHPVVDTVLWLTHVLQHLGEKLAQEIIVWRLFKTQPSNIILKMRSD